MAFQSGKSGNPSGRPKGALNKRTELVRLLDTHAEALVNTLIQLALKGDIKALQLCIERLVPKAKHPPLNEPLIDFDPDNSITWSPTLGAIVKSTLSGEITPDDAKKLIGIIEEHKSRNEFSNFTIDF